jgi:hypothetical protein
MKVAEVCRKHEISEPTFYACKAKFGGMNVSPSQWSEASVADAHAVAAAARTESELVSGLRLGHADRRTAVPHPGGGR